MLGYKVVKSKYFSIECGFRQLIALSVFKWFLHAHFWLATAKKWCSTGSPFFPYEPHKIAIMFTHTLTYIYINRFEAQTAARPSPRPSVVSVVQYTYTTEPIWEHSNFYYTFWPVTTWRKGLGERELKRWFCECTHSSTRKQTAWTVFGLCQSCNGINSAGSREIELYPSNRNSWC